MYFPRALLARDEHGSKGRADSITIGFGKNAGIRAGPVEPPMRGE
jgi:hypothetical protein